MKIYLAGPHHLTRFRDGLELATAAMKGESMRVYLAGTAPWRKDGIYDEAIKEHRPYILESFFYCDEHTERLLPLFGDFMLDSGAFTFMQGRGHTEWEEYAERYSEYIKKHKIEKFFELDIDSVVGYDKVKELRKTIERKTGRQSIPVWHTNRGKDEFVRMCEEYPYVAIGGLVGGKSEYARKYWKAFPWFITTAHKNGAKIHALGFTSLEGIARYHFDSVDSTAWTTGNRFGYVYYFDGKTMRHKDTPKGMRMSDTRKVAVVNYLEWIKFQKYAERNL